MSVYEVKLIFFFPHMFQQIIQGLQKIGHETERLESAGSTVTGIARKGGKIYASTDFRRGGVTAGF
jgi:gamma-glutamyltranspeptidase